MTKLVALLSAYDKTGLDGFGRELVKRGWEIWGSRGTVTYLAEHNVTARDVAEMVGPPILGHKVVTLSREIHAGLLADNSDVDVQELERLSLRRISLVYVSLYPLEQEVIKPTATLESIRQNTDIGGPTLLRSAAKGDRIVLSSQAQLRSALITVDLLEPQQSLMRLLLASMAEEAVATYCAVSAKALREEHAKLEQNLKAKRASSRAENS